MQLGFDKGLSKTRVGKVFIRKDYVMKQGGPEKVINDYSLTCKGGVNAFMAYLIYGHTSCREKFELSLLRPPWTKPMT